jgi:alkylation response protein AidB-like acyl-CoA dehydrogenase
VVHALASATNRPAGVLEELVQGAGWATWIVADRSGASLSIDGSGRLTGTADVVPGGPDCSWFLVAADGPAGRTQVVVAADTPGVTVRDLHGLDVTRRWATITFDDVSLGEDVIVGTPGAPTDAAMASQTQLAAVLTAAETVGAMHADHAIAVQYAKDRIAFGRPIGSFQAVKHLLANTSLYLEMSKAIVANAADALGRGEPDGPQLAHAAKAFVTEHSIELAHGCFQVFGGIGYTWEHDQHLFLRRIAADAQVFGSAADHRYDLIERAEVAS